jgi:parallel beta-helix repeat protein
MQTTTWTTGTRIRAISVIGLAGSLVAALGSARAAQLTCGAVVGPGGTTVLEGNVGPCDGPGAALTVNSATLDLGGFSVACADTNGDGAYSDGIRLQGKKAKLRNGTVTGCQDAVLLDASGKHQVTGVTATANREDGFEVDNAAPKCKLSANTATANGDDGFEIEGDKGQYRNNTAERNGGDGFSLLTADGNVLTGNAARSNGDDGFGISGSRNVFTRNTASANSEDGFDISGGGRRNRLTRNTANGHVAPNLDLEDSNSCGANSWRRNPHGSSSAPCVK